MQDEVNGSRRPADRQSGENGSASRRGSSANRKSGDSSQGDEGTVSVIGADITITGDIHASEDLMIEGTVEGSVTCGTLILGESGRVLGDIRTDRSRISGLVEGSIVTSDLAVEATAEINGDIEYSRLRVSSGGVIFGQLRPHSAEILHTDRGDQREQSGQQTRPRKIAVYEDRSYHEAGESMRNAAA